MIIIPEGILAAALFGGVISLEKSSMGMFLSEPMIICAAAGAFLGNFESGLMIGLFWQIIWMSDLPVGAVKLPDGSTGALVSACLYITMTTKYPQLEHSIFFISILIGGISAYLAGQFMSDKRKVHALYIDWADNYADRNSTAGIDFVTSIGIIEQFLSGVFITIFLYFAFGNLLEWATSFIPVYIDGLFSFLPTALWGISAALLLQLAWNRKTVWAIVLGIILGGKLFGIY